MMEQLFQTGFGNLLDPWFDSTLSGPLLQWDGARRSKNYPPIAISQDHDRITLLAELPGIDPKDLDITVQGNVVSVKGVRKPYKCKEEETLLTRERPYGEFFRSFELSSQVDPEKIKAEYKNGVLVLTLARPEKEKPKKITIQTS